MIFHYFHDPTKNKLIFLTYFWRGFWMKKKKGNSTSSLWNWRFEGKWIREVEVPLETPSCRNVKSHPGLNVNRLEERGEPLVIWKMNVGDTCEWVTVSNLKWWVIGWCFLGLLWRIVRHLWFVLLLWLWMDNSSTTYMVLYQTCGQQTRQVCWLNNGKCSQVCMILRRQIITIKQLRSGNRSYKPKLWCFNALSFLKDSSNVKTFFKKQSMNRVFVPIVQRPIQVKREKNTTDFIAIRKPICVSNP